MPHERAITRRKSTLNGFKRDSYTMYTSTHTQYRGKQPSLTAREQETEERELTCVVATSVYGFVGTSSPESSGFSSVLLDETGSNKTKR